MNDLVVKAKKKRRKKACFAFMPIQTIDNKHVEWVFCAANEAIKNIYTDFSFFRRISEERKLKVAGWLRGMAWAVCDCGLDGSGHDGFWCCEWIFDRFS